ncbi:zinc carboxypeptidase [Niabella ginsenosidivorans]|uniref:Zinc carboxypeptidase n=1 Tax=Niabella ginsenosidivorans TaxID=1176587 RepID=A0A1A9HWZ8_9BACT|nr:M14 metallopeptidase family protein [Niabella ginsenosidivorans]ANH79906.1 zinc carboxypeptidase [Niabella ginsenosidivorans]
MFKRFFLLISVGWYCTSGFSQLQAPESFLGYKPGNRFTPHYRLVEYFKHVAANSKMVQLYQYGETNEHRPLIVAYVGEEQNLQHIDAIRQKNLAMANGQAQAAGAPVIVWLSYNVHGNEPASSEAAMLTLYELVNPANAGTKEWLKNTLVIIDPCLNPDGRDRYVNWYNGVVGKSANAFPQAREHREPWPQGRSNHYNFDLNRDWAWQTQQESRYRVALYNQWLPQIHVDFHEQGYNAPYYFAPAAEPYHDVLTKWQRDFQKVIGKNHAKYFDQKGWLYFTKERFDLFYPSYGDTYPLYSGAIGMTYEQGGISAGLAVQAGDGDTVTLVSRVAHHVTTGLSTVETASANAAQLLQQYSDYFANAAEGKTGSYRSFIIKYSKADEQKLDALKKLLTKNSIRYGTATGSGKGWNYDTRREETFSIEKKDIVVSTRQPRSALIQVLFEPESRLTDSVTYDITAWALPYAYGLKGYASRQVFTVNAVTANDEVRGGINEAYGYVMPWGMNTARAAAQLLQNRVKLRIAENDFTFNHQKFSKGAVIILKTGNNLPSSDLLAKVKAAADSNMVPVSAVSTGMVDTGFDFGSPSVRAVKAPRVVLVTGPEASAYAAGEVWSFFDNELKYPVSLVNSNDLNKLNLGNVDVIIVPDGNYDFLSGKESSAFIAAWVRNGGRLIALESAVTQLSKLDWCSLKLKEDSASRKDSIIKPSVFGSREREEVSETTPGSIYRVRVDNTHPLMFGYPDYYYTLKMDNKIYRPIAKDGWNVGIINSDNKMSGFTGTKLLKKMKDGVLFAVQDLGKGNIIYLTDDVLFRNFWENGKLLFTNAVFLVGED